MGGVKRGEEAALRLCISRALRVFLDIERETGIKIKSIDICV